MKISKRIHHKLLHLLHLHPDVGGLVSGSYRLTNPNSADFPSENVPFASRVIATGIWNYCFFQFYRHFAGPYWVERQYHPNDPSFMPRGASMLSVNLTHRNWMGFRSPLSDHFSLVDPAGALSPVIGCYTIELAVEEESHILLPARGEVKVKQKPYRMLPIPMTKYKGKVSEIKWLVSGSTTYDNSILSSIEYKVKDGCRASLLLAVRPFNPEGGVLIHSIEVAQTEQTGLVSINDQPEIVLMNLPDEVNLCNLKTGDAYFQTGEKNYIECPHGIATGLFRYAIQGEGRISFIAQTYEQNRHDTKRASELQKQSAPFTVGDLQTSEIRKLKKDKQSFLKQILKNTEEIFITKSDETNAACLMQNHIPDEIERCADLWKDKLSKASQFQGGRTKWNNASKIFCGYLRSLQTDHTITPGVFTYRQFWFRDASYMLHALTAWNFIEESEQVYRTYPLHQDRHGFFKSHEGEWDSNGQAIWTLFKHVELSGNHHLVESMFLSIQKGIRWIINKRKTGYKKKLMPPGFSAEHLGPAGYYYWDNYWSIAALEKYADYLKTRNLDEDAKEHQYIQAEIQQYKNDLLEVSHHDRMATGIISAGPERPVDAGMIGNVALLYPLNLSIFPDEQVRASVLEIYKSFFQKNLFFHPIIHSGYNIYLTIQVAQALFRIGEVATARDILKRVLNVKTDLWTYPEAIHPITGGGVMGDGFHGWAFADILLLLRDFTVYQLDHQLEIFKGLRERELYSENLSFGPFPVAGKKITITGRIDKKGGTLSIQNISSSITKSWVLDFCKKIDTYRIYIPNIKHARIHNENNDSVYVTDTCIEIKYPSDSLNLTWSNENNHELPL